MKGMRIGVVNTDETETNTNTANYNNSYINTHMNVLIPTNIFKKGRKNLYKVSQLFNSIDLFIIVNNATIIANVSIDNDNDNLQNMIENTENIKMNAIDITMNADNMIFNDTNNVTIQFMQTQNYFNDDINVKNEINCLYYNEYAQLWQNDGCFHVTTTDINNDNIIVCQCYVY